jgi:cellulose synthase/poly-beta-1,6-N-acetylglucosamine synthase-like glycosyltransferase
MTPTLPSRRARQARVAEAAGLELVDLLVHPPDPALFADLDHHTLVQEQWVPWRRAEGGATPGLVQVASVSPLDAAQLRSVAATLGVDQVVDRITTDWDIEHVVLDVYRDLLVHDATDGLAETQGDLSSKRPWRARQSIGIALVLAVAIVALVLAPSGTTTVLFTLANLVFLAAASFKVVAAIGSRRLGRADDQGDAPADPDRLADEDLPLFTILVPAYREAGITQQLVDNLGGIDYPTAKLQILLLLEEDDQETIDAFRATAAPDHVHMVLVPAGQPRTKPKACNIGLALARGEFLVIYDAEDVPDPLQLRSVVAQFRASGPEVACIQCRLNYHNVEENLLTRMFTLEYSFWFTYMLRGLDRMHLPIPLGGSSNHFRTDVLRELGGWDPHNVTEDADLGLRATALGYKVAANPSITMEEACSRTGPWIRQRTRWIKGYMVTFLVHARHPIRFTRATGLRGTLCLLLLIAGTPGLYLASSIVWSVWLFTFLGGTIGWLHLPPLVKLLNAVVFLLGNGAMIAVHAIAGRARQRRLAIYSLLLPIYWTLHSFAAWRALWHLLVKPDVWEKTPHGLAAAAAADAEVPNPAGSPAPLLGTSTT